MRRLFTIVFVAALASSTVQARVPTAGAGEKSADAGDRMICKRFTRTGTLAAIEKICKTKHEWELDRASLRQQDSIDSCRTRGTNGVGC
jgi:hypothetical protein